MIRNYFLIVCSIFLLAACSNGGGTGSDVRTPVSVSMKIPELAKASVAGKPVSEGVLSVSVRAEKSGGTGLLAAETENVTAGQTLSIELKVEAGLAHVFTVEAFSQNQGTGIVLFRGTKTVDILVDTSPSITIDMQAVSDGIQIFPKNAAVTKGATEQFSISGVDPAQVDWRVVDSFGGVEGIGSISPDGLYKAPDTIPYNTSGTTLGVPVSIVVEAINKNTQALIAGVPLKLVTGNPLVFGRNEQVSAAGASTTSSGQRSIVFQEGVVYATWQENSAILFAESPDGIDWSQQTVVHIGSPDPGEDPALALADDGTIYIAFREGFFQTGFRTALFRRKSGETNFESWSQNLNATGNNTENPSVAVGTNGTVFVAWAEDLDPDRFGRQWDVVLQRLDASGTPLNQTNPAPVSIGKKEDVDEKTPVLAVSKLGDAQVFLAWTERDNTTHNTSEINLLATVSKDGGASFLTAVQVNDTANPRDVFRPSIAAGPLETVYLAWESDPCLGDCDIRGTFDVGRLAGDKLEFGADKFIRDDARMRQFQLSLAWDGATGVYITFRAFSPVQGIFMVKSTDEGSTFQISQVDDDTLQTTQTNASLAVDGTGRVFAIWTDLRGGTASSYVWFARGE